MFYELDAAAVTAVGGTSLFGGRGSVWGTLAGAFFIGVLNNGLNLFEVQHYDQQIVKGFVLLAATSLDLWRGREGAGEPRSHSYCWRRWLSRRTDAVGRSGSSSRT